MKWLRGIKLASHSRSFNFQSEPDWVFKLECVHEHAWRTWKKLLADDAYKNFPLQLTEGQAEQRPGKISAELVANLRPRIAEMPPKKNEMIGLEGLPFVFCTLSQLSLSLTTVEMKKCCCDLLSLNLSHRAMNFGVCTTFTWCG